MIIGDTNLKSAILMQKLFTIICVVLLTACSAQAPAPKGKLKTSTPMSVPKANASTKEKEPVPNQPVKEQPPRAQAPKNSSWEEFQNMITGTEPSKPCPCLKGFPVGGIDNY